MKIPKQKKFLNRGRKPYSNDDMLKALEDVAAGVSFREAASKYNLKKSTIYAKYNHVSPLESAPGPNPYLSYDEEKTLEDYLLYCSDHGFPITKQQFLQIVAKLIKSLGRKTPFKDGVPGRGWWEGFCKRHPNISLRLSQNLNQTRAAATPEVLQEWFQVIANYIQEKNLQNVKPSSIFNMDESAFFLVPKGDKVLARKGSKAVYKVVSGDDKESLTVLFSINAEGLMLPPLILFWYERIPKNVAQSVPSDWYIGSTETGWMTGEAFYNFIKGNFYNWLLKNNVEFPVILYLDGHKSHISLQLSMFCSSHGIHLIGLYPNSTHILQPLDVAVFSPLKKEWKVSVNNWRMEHGLQNFSKDQFSPVLKKTIDSMPNLSNTIKNGFRTCGLFPFQPSAVDYSIYNKKNKGTRCNKQESIQIPLNKKAEEKDAGHLKFFEEQIGPATLASFEDAYSRGDLQIEGDQQPVYIIWTKMKKITDENSKNSIKKI